MALGWHGLGEERRSQKHYEKHQDAGPNPGSAGCRGLAWGQCQCQCRCQDGTGILGWGTLGKLSTLAQLQGLRTCTPQALVKDVPIQKITHVASVAHHTSRVVSKHSPLRATLDPPELTVCSSLPLTPPHAAPAKEPLRACSACEASPNPAASPTSTLRGSQERPIARVARRGAARRGALGQPHRLNAQKLRRTSARTVWEKANPVNPREQLRNTESCTEGLSNLAPGSP